MVNIRPIAFALAASLLSACASGPTSTVRLVGFLANKNEFQLYDTAQNYGVPGHCTSLAFADHARTPRAEALVGKHVVVTGRIVNWRADHPLKIGNSAVTNSCAGRSVLVARDINTIDDAMATALTSP